MTDGKPRILILRLTAIGDVVRVLPTLHVLRDTFPKARIDWAVEQKAAGALEGHPALDKVLVFERPQKKTRAFREFLAFCRRVRANRYDIVLDYHGIFKSGIITALSGARERIGFSRPRSQEGSWLFTNKKVKLPHQRMNRVEENMALCNVLACRKEWPNVTIYVPPETQQAVDDFFEETFDGGKLVAVIHVPVDREEKQWPAEHYAELSDLLLADGRFEVLLTWGPGQLDVVQEVVRLSRRNPVVAPEIVDLKHYAWIAQRADLFFGGDTGPMHIAWLMGTPTVVVFGGTDPAKHAPFAGAHAVLADEALRAGKLPTSLEAARESLESIIPEAAYDACITLLGDRLGSQKAQAPGR